MYVYLTFATVDSVPSLKSLYEQITPHYAPDWKVIGTLLGLPTTELKAIEEKNPTNFKWCCNTMLEKWLDVDKTASWGKISAAIESPAISSRNSQSSFGSRGDQQ